MNNPKAAVTLVATFKPSRNGLPSCSTRRILTESRDRLYGTSVRMAAELATEARKEADKLACLEQTHAGLPGVGGARHRRSADALNAGYGYLEVRCLGCDTRQAVDLSSTAASSRSGELADDEAHE